MTRGEWLSMANLNEEYWIQAIVSRQTIMSMYLSVQLTPYTKNHISVAILPVFCGKRLPRQMKTYRIKSSSEERK
jgi:hypothetical protein